MPDTLDRVPAEPQVDAQAPRFDQEPTAQLIREAVDETRQLVRLEVALAREELKAELTKARAGAIAVGAAGAAALCALTLFLVTIALAFGSPWLAALIIGAIVLTLAAAIGLGGWKMLPKRPLGETRERLESDLKQLKERIA